MKSIIKSAVVVIFSSIITLSVGSALAMGFAKQDSSRFDYIFNQLRLTESERALVLDIMQEQRKAHMSNVCADPQAWTENMKNLSEEERASFKQQMRSDHLAAISSQIETVISVSQTEKLIEYLEAHGPKQRMHKKGPKMNSGMSGKKGDKLARMCEKLATADQG